MAMQQQQPGDIGSPASGLAGTFPLEQPQGKHRNGLLFFVQFLKSPFISSFLARSGVLLKPASSGTVKNLKTITSSTNVGAF